MFITITRSMLRRVAAAAAAFAVVAALFMMFPQGKTEQTAAADGNWGLSFRAEGSSPKATSPPESCGSGMRIMWAIRRKRLFI